MSCLYSTITLFPKTEIQKPFSQGKKIIFKVIFPIFFYNENFETGLSFCFLALETLLLEQYEQEHSKSGKTRSSEDQCSTGDQTIILYQLVLNFISVHAYFNSFVVMYSFEVWTLDLLKVGGIICSISSLKPH